MSQKEHWEQVYSGKAAEELGWYAPHLKTSLAFTRELHLAKDSEIIDVGGGLSTLVDDLLDEGYRHITVLDLSQKALSSMKIRLGARAESVTWLEGDITSIALPKDRYDLWHDRAVFHFLTDPEQRKKYLVNLTRALKPGGYIVIGTFALEAPPRCSGLPVQRYSPEALQEEFGKEFTLERHQQEVHLTPNGVTQVYLYCLFHRSA